MSTLQVTNLRNPASSVANGTLNADGTTTFGGIVNFATGQTFPAASSGSAPTSPTQGSTWYDTGVTPPVLKVWNGSAWVPVASSPSGTSAPLNPSSGTTWYDTSVVPPQMKVWNGSAWVPVPSTATGTAPTSPTTGQQWTDTSQVPPVLKLWNGSAWIPATVALGTAAPTGTLTTGQLWSDTTTTPSTLKAWNGSAWVAVQAAGSGGIPASLLTATGDMIYASAASTPARLGIGTAGQVLTVSGGVPAWTTIAAGGVTSVTGTAPIASSGGATPAISITPGTARQLLQTNAGGTAAEFASNIDVPGTLDVTGVATFDSTVTVAGTHLQLNAQGDLRFADADSSNYVAFQAPATVAANVTWTLPAADGTAGAVLSTNASGVTSWNDLGNGVALNGTAIKVSIGSASAPPTVGTPAANAMTGSMYWDDVAGAMFYRYDNGGTPVWVQASAGGGGSTGSFLPLAGGTMTGAIVNAAGAVATPSLTFTGDLDTGIFSPSAGQVAIANNGTQSVTVDASGRVLIGTTTAPSAGDGQFDLAVVQGNTSGATGHGSISIQRGEAATSIISGEDIGYIKFNDSSGNSFAQIRCTADANAGSGDYPGRLSFFTTADGAAAPVEAMRINSSRQLLINGTTVIDSGSRLQIIGFTYSSEGLFTGNKTAAGNTAPIAQITVPGCYFPSGVNVGTSKVAEMTGADTSGSVPLLAMSRTGSTGEVIRFYNSSTSVGNINISATTTTYATSSDYRLKENVVPLEDATDRLKQLPVHRFNFIADPDKTVDGFLAHEAQAVVPECVTGEKDAVDEDGNPRYQGIDQSKLVPLLTAALQEALAEIESLKARLDAAGV